MAAGNVFGQSRSSAPEDRLLIGSVKTNMGHLEGACTMPSILKVVAALEAGQVPPGSLHYKTPNPRIDFEKAKARVVRSVEPWPKNKLKRASVTSAGFGGTNGHCVIDHVQEVLPNYIKPGVLGSREHANGRSNGTNGVNGKHSVNGATNGTNGTNGIHKINGTNGTHTNGTNGTRTNGTNGIHKINGSSGVYTNGNGLVAHALQHRPVLHAPGMIRKADAATRKLVVLPFSARKYYCLASNHAWALF